MYLAFLLDRGQDVCFYFNNLKYYNSPKDLAGDEGISSEWAFTVLDYFLSVHCRLVSHDKKKAFLLRNFVFKNFAYKLREVKWLAFLATLFAGLHYDCRSENKEHWAAGIGEYVDKVAGNNEKFCNIPECIIYLKFVRLYLGDQYLGLALSNHAYHILEKIVKKFEKDSFRLSQFINILSKVVIDQNKTVTFSERQNKMYGKPIFKARWSRAVALRQLNEFLSNASETKKRWQGFFNSLEPVSP